LPRVRASLTSACAAASSLSAKTGSTRCASLTVNAAPAGEFAGPCLASGGNEKSTLGESAVPSRACTDASYSALVKRRMRAGRESAAPLPPVVEPPPAAEPLAPAFEPLLPPLELRPPVVEPFAPPLELLLAAELLPDRPPSAREDGLLPAEHALGRAIDSATRATPPAGNRDEGKRIIMRCTW
jgi:hypothetical protein